jgi:hypothetical protein
MIKRLTALLGILALALAVGCGSGNDAANKADNGKPVATKAASTKAAPTEEASEEIDSGDSAGALESLSFLTGGMFGGEEQGTPQEADATLASMLIADTDLPSTFAGIGGDQGFTMTVPGSGGEATMAMRTFSEGDPNASEMTPTIISAAMTMPQSALDEYDAQLAQLDEVSADDLKEAMGGADLFGIEFTEFSVDKIDLGDGGMSMHMVMDLSGMADMFGDLMEDTGTPFPTSLSYDMYVFRKGDVVLMVMAMLPPDSDTVDVESLAEIMESRAP